MHRIYGIWLKHGSQECNNQCQVFLQLGGRSVWKRAMEGPVVYALALSTPGERTKEISEVLGNELESLILFSRI